MNAHGKSKGLITVILLLSVALFSLACGISVTQQSAHADTGPKPSVTVTIKNLNGRICYGTLISESEGSGPAHAYTPDYQYIPDWFDPESEYFDAEAHAIWEAFVNYVDPDGYYYLQTHDSCHETGEISWGYYPPTRFKILLYFPETQTFASSGICEQYAFHSYFTVKLSNTDMDVSSNETLNVRKSYNHTREIVSLLARIVVTVILELGIAGIFFIRTKKAIISVLLVNVVTQIALNVALNVAAYFEGGWSLLLYVPLELAVFVVEAVAYSIIFHRLQPKTVGADGTSANPDYMSIGRCVWFSFVANLFSFVAGLVLALVIPGVF